MGDLLDDYRLADAYDEMFVGTDDPREHYQSLNGVLQTLSRRDFEERCDARDRAFRDAGITFQLSGEERPFPLDLVPRILPADEWATIERGVRQRVLALEAFLADVYGPGRILQDGVIPRRLVV
ncbi:MAG: circularly permuted type 2 ATP-grasp protein, partial [Acidimicrobiia bacterium]